MSDICVSPEGHESNILSLSSPLPVGGPLVVWPSKNLPHQKAAGFHLHTCECLHPSGRLLILFSSLQGPHVGHAEAPPLSSVFCFSIQSSQGGDDNVFPAVFVMFTAKPSDATSGIDSGGLESVTSHLLSAATGAPSGFRGAGSAARR